MKHADDDDAPVRIRARKLRDRPPRLNNDYVTPWEAEDPEALAGALRAQRMAERRHQVRRDRRTRRTYKRARARVEAAGVQL